MSKKILHAAEQGERQSGKLWVEAGFLLPERSNVFPLDGSLSPIKLVGGGFGKGFLQRFVAAFFRFSAPTLRRSPVQKWLRRSPPKFHALSPDFTL